MALSPAYVCHVTGGYQYLSEMFICTCVVCVVTHVNMSRTAQVQMLEEGYTCGRVCGRAVSLNYLPTMLPQIARLLEAQANGEREETGS